MKTIGCGYSNKELFLSSEFKELTLRDKRLEARAKKILQALIEKFTSCVKNLFLDKDDQRQAYDFFSNIKVRNKDLIEPHFKETKNRITASKEDLLVIQDGSYINFTHHKAKIDIGRIGKTGNTEQYGFIQHSSLCVTLDNIPMGLIDLQFYNNELFMGCDHRDKRAAKDKKTNHWVMANQNLRARIKDDNKRLIRVSDRESDFFDYLHDLIKYDERFVIRAFHNRCTGKVTRRRSPKFIELIEQKEVYAQLEFKLHNASSHRLESAYLNVKVLEDISIPVPERTINKSDYETIRLNVVKAYDEERSWMLLTNLPVNSEESIRKVINCYRMRWHIEDYHKVLKTGFNIEKIYLHSSSEAIKNLLTMIAICACRLYWITFVGRNLSNSPATMHFYEYEWKAIYLYYDLQIPEEEPKVQDIILLIAKLGGYKNTKASSPPGIKTMWCGLMAFYHISKMYHVCQLKLKANC